MWGIYMSLIDIAQRNKEGQNKPSRYYSNKQEKKVAKDFNGVQTKNSGATKFGGKGDVLLPGLMSIECKTKTSKSGSISIKREWLDKIKKEWCEKNNIKLIYYSHEEKYCNINTLEQLKIELGK